jgi:hypothetical protein
MRLLSAITTLASILIYLPTVISFSVTMSSPAPDAPDASSPAIKGAIDFLTVARGLKTTPR